MKKLFAMVVIGLGLVFGVGFANEVNACEDSVVGKEYYDIFVEEFFVNECLECDSYYYVECMCSFTNALDCFNYNYERFIEDYYEVSGAVEYQPDGDTVVVYSDGSSILYDEEEEVYIMWIPETEDYEHHYNSYDDLMYAIERYHGEVTNIQYPEISEWNPNGYGIVQEQLDKVGNEVSELLETSGLEIHYDDNYIDYCEEQSGFGIAGVYIPDYNVIVMREDGQNIEQALLHEIGHSLDYNLGLRYNESLIDSYIEEEVVFDDNADYYYSSIEEYIAESIEYYYNDLLPKDTVIYQELNYILG